MSGKKRTNQRPDPEDPEERNESKRCRPGISETMQSPSVWISLPSDIFLNILSRLPMKTIGRIRCVCKLWCSRTYDPYVAQSLTIPESPLIIGTPLGEKMGLYRFKSRYVLERSSINIDDVKSRNRHLSNSVNGLTCVYSFGHGAQTRILNPTTLESVKLIASDRECLPYLNLGLGFDAVTGRYKLVRVSSEDGISYYCDVLTLGSTDQEWRLIGEAPYKIPNSYNPPVFLHGALHWMVDRYPCSEIVTFDIKDEKFGRLIRAPQCISFHSTLLEYDEGHLCIATVNFHCIEFWTLRDHTSSAWTKETVIDRSTYMRIYRVGGPTRAPRVIGVTDHDVLLELDLPATRAGHRVLCYNIRHRTLVFLELRVRSGLLIHKQGLAFPMRC